jgi:hypothetical protein
VGTNFAFGVRLLLFGGRADSSHFCTFSQIMNVFRRKNSFLVLFAVAYLDG